METPKLKLWSRCRFSTTYRTTTLVTINAIITFAGERSGHRERSLREGWRGLSECLGEKPRFCKMIGDFVKLTLWPWLPRGQSSFLYIFYRRRWQFFAFITYVSITEAETSAMSFTDRLPQPLCMAICQRNDERKLCRSNFLRYFFLTKSTTLWVDYGIEASCSRISGHCTAPTLAFDKPSHRREG